LFLTSFYESWLNGANCVTNSLRIFSQSTDETNDICEEYPQERNIDCQKEKVIFLFLDVWMPYNKLDL
jgi:hypothetical protein